MLVDNQLFCFGKCLYAFCASYECQYQFQSFFSVARVTPCQPRNGTLPQTHVHIWSICSDNGADQAAFRAQLKTLLRGPGYERQLLFEAPCLKHQLHLLTLDTLKMASQFLGQCGHSGGYFSSLAKVCHTWRAHGTKLAKVWQAAVPGAYNFKASCCVPPLAIGGRWGSIDGFLASDMQEI